MKSHATKLMVNRIGFGREIGKEMAKYGSKRTVVLLQRGQMFSYRM
jgi:hypothetical protein